MNVITVWKQKGGVGKTTIVVKLAAASALKRQKMLVIDADPQSNAFKFQENPSH